MRVNRFLHSDKRINRARRKDHSEYVSCPQMVAAQSELMHQCSSTFPPPEFLRHVDDVHDEYTYHRERSPKYRSRACTLKTCTANSPASTIAQPSWVSVRVFFGS